MAFDFLTTANAVVGIGAGLAGLFGDEEPQAPAIFPSMVQASKRAGQIAKALAQPDLGPYSGLVDELEGQYARETSMAFKDLMEADHERRVRSASGLGVFSDDRRDETLTREWIRARSDQKQRARDNARNYLMGALEANSVAMGGYGTVANTQYNLDRAQNDFRLGQYEAGASLASGLLDAVRNKPSLSSTVGLLNGGNYLPQAGGASLTHYPTFSFEK